jgi:hypothetical protein
LAAARWRVEETSRGASPIGGKHKALSKEYVLATSFHCYLLSPAYSAHPVHHPIPLSVSRI